MVTALGMIETVGLIGAIEAADAGLKAASVRLLGTDYVRGGLVMVRFEGEVAEVQAAVDAGAERAGRLGKVFQAQVIPRAMPEIFCMLASDISVGPNRLYSSGCKECCGCEGGKREWQAIARANAEDRRKKKEAEALLAAQQQAEQPAAEAPKAPEVPQENVPAAKDRGPQQTAEAAPLIITKTTPMEELAARKVTALRSAVRKLPGFPLTAGEIRYANKQSLCDAIAAWQQKEE